MNSFKGFKNLYGCLRHVLAVATVKFLLPQLAETSQNILKILLK